MSMRLPQPGKEARGRQEVGIPGKLSPLLAKMNNGLVQNLALPCTRLKQASEFVLGINSAHASMSPESPEASGLQD